MSLLGTVIGGTVAAMGAIMAGTVAVRTLHGHRRARRRLRDRQAIREGTAGWEALADEYDLYFDPEGPGLHGDLDGMPVQVEILDPSDRVYTRVRIEGVVRQLFLGPRVGDGRTGYDDTGDPAFDARALVQGAPAVLVGWLDHRTRALWLDRVAVSPPVPTVRDGAVRVSVDRVLPAEALREVLDRSALLARALRTGGRTTDHRLEQVSRTDPLAAIRRRALTLLLQRLRPGQEDEIVDRALEDDDPQVRLLAARHAGRVRMLADLATDPRLDEDLRWTALEALFPREGRVLEGALDTLLADPEDPLAPRAVQHLGRRQGPGDLERLVGLASGPLASGQHRAERTATATARALGRFDDPAAETPLLLLLRTHADDGLRRAVYEALGRVGTLDSVEILRRHAESRREVAYEARQALRAVLSRAHGVDEGALSLAEGPGDSTGALSLSDDRAGSVTLTEED